MPFSPANIRFTTLLIGVILLAAVSVFGIVLIARTPAPPPTLYATVMGIPSMIVMQLLHMLRTEHVNDSVRQTGQQLSEQVSKTRHDLKGTVGTAIHGIEHVAKQLNGGSDAEQEPSPYVRRDELEPLLESIAERICEKMRRDSRDPPG